jgi:hypothetical protein
MESRALFMAQWIRGWVIETRRSLSRIDSILWKTSGITVGGSCTEILNFSV